MGERRGVYRVCWKNARQRDHLEGLGTDKGIILKWIFRKGDEVAWTGLIWLRVGTSGRHLLTWS
jgi:hypothetical protein